jgi:hypothetical protein
MSIFHFHFVFVCFVSSHIPCCILGAGESLISKPHLYLTTLSFDACDACDTGGTNDM